MRAPSQSIRRRLPLVAAFLVPLLVVCVLSWPLPGSLGTAWNPSVFGASHAWLGDHLWRVLTEGESMHSTLRTGYPWTRSGRFIGWLPLLASLPLRPLLGPIATFQVLELLSLPLMSLAAWPLLRRWSKAEPWTVAAGCIAFALSPYALGVFSNGELPKLSLGLIPLFLWALDRARCQERGGSWAALAAALALVTGFTSPYYGLVLPLLTVGLLGVDAVKRRRLWRPLALGVAVAAGLVPVALYHGQPSAEVIGSIFMPAASPGPQEFLSRPHPSASLVDLLVGLPPQTGGLLDSRHIAYVGTLLLLALAVLAWRQRDQRPGRWAALALLSAGALLALGPWLYPVEARSDVPLPSLLFIWLRYPLASGGMFHRLVVMSSLGLALWLVVECARRPRLAWLLLLLQLADGVRASGPWPLPTVPVPGVAHMGELQGDDGAVLELPLSGEHFASQQALLLASLHGRPTTALPRMALPAEQVVQRRLWVPAFSSQDPPAALRALGIRYLMLQSGDTLLEAHITKKIGEPMISDGLLRVWELGPTQLVPRELVEFERARSQTRRDRHGAGEGHPQAPSLQRPRSGWTE